MHARIVRAWIPRMPNLFLLASFERLYFTVKIIFRLYMALPTVQCVRQQRVQFYFILIYTAVKAINVSKKNVIRFWVASYFIFKVTAKWNINYTLELIVLLY